MRWGNRSRAAGLGSISCTASPSRTAGESTLTSEPGKGSTFTLSLPAMTDRASAEYVAADLETRPSS